ncbi:MAG: TetR family transcriptional regulator [Halioglobus sp.]|nr:TetR family transcriptional regulator [Halioglobus sp.]
MPNHTQAQLAATPLELLVVAERLFSMHGVDGVSTREIARAAGQKNHSAVAYHFGSKEALVERILDYRLVPINTRREALLKELEAAGKTQDVRSLVHALAAPFVEELRADPGESHYIGFISQLVATDDGARLRGANIERNAATYTLGDYLFDALAHLPAKLRANRLQMLGAQLTAVVATWDRQRREETPPFRSADLPWMTENLVDMLTAGMQAPVSAATAAAQEQEQDA